MNQELTDITVLLDRSGSMSSCATDVIGGFNSFLRDQRAGAGWARLTLIQFDSTNDQEIVYLAKPVAEAPNLTPETFKPRGSTPLYDAMGKAIVATGERLAAMPEAQRPSKVVFLVMTDGYENHSREYTHFMIRDMVKTQTEKYSWAFIFIGADIDAMAQGGMVGLNRGSTVQINSANTIDAFNLTSAKLRSYRVSADVSDLNYSQAERDTLNKADQKS